MACRLLFIRIHPFSARHAAGKGRERAMTHLWNLTAAVVACCTLLAGPALAVPIVGSSHGTFSGLSSCDNSGFFQNCRITSSSNGANTQVQWGSTSLLPYVNPSTLTAVDVTINDV